MLQVKVSDILPSFRSQEDVAAPENLSMNQKTGLILSSFNDLISLLLTQCLADPHC